MTIRRNRVTAKELFRQTPIHTFFLAAHPIVSLLAFNISQIYAQDALKSLLISLFITAIILCGLRILSKNWQLAGLLTSLLVVWFFLYGRLYIPLKSFSVFGVIIGRHRYLLVAWSGIFFAIAFWLVKKPRVIPDLTMVLNIFSTILICLPIIQIVAFYLRNLTQFSNPTVDSVTPSISWTEDLAPPDIYYIVLDEYTRSDVLEEEFGFDNSTFLGDLRKIGFYVAECAQSNYPRTAHSFAALLNMEYVQALETGIKPDQDSAWLLPYVKYSVTRQQLERLGYKTIVFKNPWERYLWEDASIVFRSSGTDLLSPFEYLLLRTTVVRVYLDLREAEIREIANYTNYEDTLYALKQLPHVPEIPGPKFVFVHLIIPHPPFVFGPNGEKIDIPYDADAGHVYTEENYKQGYVAAMSYINNRMIEIIPQIIQASETTPIIIIAGDHGTPWGGPQNAVKILAAFFAPGSNSHFYKTITPVNIFRIIFDTYFNGEFGLLPDRSYLFTKKGRFDFQETPIVCDETN